jgi:MarR-like DNA-binding transcriptional regulator SgrR of sgrS sRNA
LTINANKKGPLEDLAFRKALYHLIDRESLVDDIGHSNHRTAHSFQLDVERARGDGAFLIDLGLTELNKSSYKGEILHLYTYERHSKEAFWLKEAYGQYGIQIEVHLTEWKDLLDPDLIQLADFILFEAVMSEGIIRLLDYFLSPGSFIRAHSSKSLAHFIDSTIQNLLTEPAIATTYNKLFQIEDGLKEDYRLIFLNYKTVSTLSHDSLKGVRLNGKGWVDFSTVWFKR